MNLRRACEISMYRVAALGLLLVLGCAKSDEEAPSPSTEPTATEAAPSDMPRKRLELFVSGCEKGVALNGAPLDDRADSCAEAAIKAREMKEDDTAFRMATKACELGSARGCFVLAACHSLGQGTARDEHKALVSIRKACEGGFDPACRVLRDVEEPDPKELVEQAVKNGELDSYRLRNLFDDRRKLESLFPEYQKLVEAAADEFDRHELQEVHRPKFEALRKAEIEALEGKPRLVTLTVHPYDKEYNFDLGAWTFFSMGAAWLGGSDNILLLASWGDDWAVYLRASQARVFISKDKLSGCVQEGRKEQGYKHAVGKFLWPMSNEAARKDQDRIREMNALQLAVVPTGSLWTLGKLADYPRAAVAEVAPVAYRLCHVANELRKEKEPPPVAAPECEEWLMLADVGAGCRPSGGSPRSAPTARDEQLQSAEDE